MAFLEIIGAVGSAVSISGFSAKDLIPFVTHSDKKEFNDYFIYLEAKRVLVAPFDAEATHAVIKSLETIKEETEKLRLKLSAPLAQHFTLDLIHTLSRELMDLYKRQGSNDEILFYKVLQIVRVKFARVLSILCASYKIDLTHNQTELAKLVLEHAYRPK
ncbi:hypothetical protein RND59_00160 [Vibrio ruber]|uniref:hypothetical protein n=1 Tax=Vibrio ruber TaxID=184755 RepID=UPI002892EED3|nr:hypothetical protein [Vibrio ruber]WNJ95572.1 hypothetical protein RND59_00160 [Vibrio ruber]